MYEEILVPTDGSEATDLAVEHAVDIARNYGARIHPLYVVDSSVYPRLDAGSEMIVESLEEEGRNAVSAVVDVAERVGVQTRTAVESGPVHETILGYADEHGIDLVVMATHGRSGIDRYLLGSVTEKVVRRSDAPVLTVRASDGGSETDSAGAEDEARPL